MSTVLLLVALLGCFVLGALALGAALLLWPLDESSANFERREEERRLQRLTHAALLQMFHEARRGGGAP